MTELEGKPKLEDSFGEKLPVCQAFKPSDDAKRSDWWVSDVSRCQYRCARTAWGIPQLLTESGWEGPWGLAVSKRFPGDFCLLLI